MDTSASSEAKPPAPASAAKPKSKPTKSAAPKKSGAKKSAAKMPGKSAKRSAKPKSRKPSPKKAPFAGKNPGGRPMLFPDKTILRLPAGSLKVINAKAKAAGKSQGEFLRGVVGKVTGK